MLRQTNNLPDNRRYSSPKVNLETVSRRCSSVETDEHQKIGIFRGDIQLNVIMAELSREGSLEALK